jgi:hypothetical protein
VLSALLGSILPHLTGALLYYLDETTETPGPLLLIAYFTMTLPVMILGYGSNAMLPLSCFWGTISVLIATTVYAIVTRTPE